MKFNVTWEHIQEEQAWIIFRDVVLSFDIDRKIDNVRMVLRPTKPSVWRLTNLEEAVYNVSEEEIKAWVKITDHYALWRLALKIVYEAIWLVTKSGKSVFTAYDDRIVKKKPAEFKEEVIWWVSTSDTIMDLPETEPLWVISWDDSQPMSVESVDVFWDWEKLSLTQESIIKVPMTIKWKMIANPIKKKEVKSKAKAKTKSKSKIKSLSELKWSIWLKK